jgi:hypothetical protein
MIQLAEIYRQAERGNTPTIHDPLVVPVKAEQTGE